MNEVISFVAAHPNMDAAFALYWVTMAFADALPPINTPDYPVTRSFAYVVIYKLLHFASANLSRTKGQS